MSSQFVFSFFNDTATTEIYTLSLHDALPILKTNATETAMPLPSPLPGASRGRSSNPMTSAARTANSGVPSSCSSRWAIRSEEHTSELQPRQYLVCRLLLEKKKTSDLQSRRSQ